MINISVLRSAIEEGARKYLEKTTFSNDFFAEHGEKGRLRANKINNLLSTISVNDALRVLALADAIFFSEIGPTLCEFIFDEIIQKKAITDISSSLISQKYGFLNRIIVAEKIQDEIKKLTSDGEEEPAFFRMKRSASLSDKNVEVNSDMFDAYFKIKDNAAAQEIKIVVNSSCTLI
jgi:hypothetical protein